MRIPLPDFKKHGDQKAHAYPFRIAWQTIEIIQASVFYVMLADLAAGEYFRGGGKARSIEAKLIEEGLYPSAADDGWKYLKKYQGLLERSVTQNVLITMRSNWDWFVRRLVEFVIYSRRFVKCPDLSNKSAKDLTQIDRRGILTQLKLLSAATGINFPIDESDLERLSEMSLVRNLGLHNRWEVDQTYLSKSLVKSFQLGEMRAFDGAELTEWYQSLLVCIRQTAKHIAIKFVNAPEYPPPSS